MDSLKVAEHLRQHLVYISTAKKYDTREKQLLYEQGILLGLIATLSLNDSSNFDIVIKKLKELENKINGDP